MQHTGVLFPDGSSSRAKYPGSRVRLKTTHGLTRVKSTAAEAAGHRAAQADVGHGYFAGEQSLLG